MPVMRDAIQRFMNMPSQYGTECKLGKRPPSGTADFADALAKYIASELDATFGEVVEALGKHNEQQKLPFATLTVFDHGGGSVRDGNGILFHWPNSDNPGRAAVEAIQTHTEPEPSAVERFDRLAKALDKRAMMAKLSTEELEDIMAVRKALEESK